MSETITSPRAPLPVDRSEQAAAASAGARINIPLNLDNWRTLDKAVQEEMLWLHQHLLDRRMTWDDAGAALNYDRSTVFRVLKGTYEGSWDNVIRAIRSYRKLAEVRGTIQKNEFVPNAISRLIHAGLDYALANNSITLIVGESRMGKTMSSMAWRDANNHGRSVYVIAPAYGGTKALLRDIASAIGVNKNLSAVQMHEAILRGFNRHRILIVDEAHRLLPGDRRCNPVNLEVLRDLHDRTGCALALLATQRFDTELRKSDYMFEQLLGRIGLPVRLPRKIKAEDIAPIIDQYVSRPGARLNEVCLGVANELGRLGILVERLKVASRIAAKEQRVDKPRITEAHVFKAIALGRQMMGETTYASK